MTNEKQNFDGKYFPAVFAGIFFTAIIISSVIALVQNDVEPWFPAISDTATNTPESNIFSQLVNISTFIGLTLMYIRYLQVKHGIEKVSDECQTTDVLNRYGLPVGLMSMLGCSIVANFPVGLRSIGSPIAIW